MYKYIVLCFAIPYCLLQIHPEARVIPQAALASGVLTLLLGKPISKHHLFDLVLPSVPPVALALALALTLA